MRSAILGLATLLSLPLQATTAQTTKDYVSASEIAPDKNFDSETWRPMPSIGTPKILVIDAQMRGIHLAQPESDLEVQLRFVEEHFASVSHGALQPDLIYGGRVEVDPIWYGTCESGVMFALAEQIDSQIPLDLTQFDARMYLLPGQGACWFGGLGTLEGNPSLPLTYRGLAPSQSWILLPGSLTLMIHELGHNLGLSHASTPGEEYGDYSDVMGPADAERFGWPENQMEMRDFNAQHRRDLGWSMERIINRSGRYVLSPAENGASVFAIPLPGAEEWAYTLSFRNGLLATHALYGQTGLRDEFVSGASIHHVARDGFANTTLFSVLADHESFFLDGGRPGNQYVQVTQKSHDANAVMVDVQFTVNSQSEGIYAPRTCWDGIDNDGDGRLDFTGDGVLRAEGSLCAFPWRAIEAPKMVSPNQRYVVTCTSTYGWQPRLGPMLVNGEGDISSIAVNGGRYSASVTAPESCGTTQTIRCGSDASGAVILNPLEATVKISCDSPCRDVSCTDRISRSNY